jgi:hypothetical protein
MYLPRSVAPRRALLSSRWMPRRALAFALSVGFVATACGHAPPQAPTDRLAPGTIVWPSSLDHPSTPATHHEAAMQLLVESGVAAAMVAMQDVMLRQQLELNPIIKPYENVLRAFFAKYTSFEAMREDFVKLYMERFSELQLRQIVAFYQTPTGKLAVHEIPKVIEAGAALGKRKVEEHMAELKQMMEEQGPSKP